MEEEIVKIVKKKVLNEELIRKLLDTKYILLIDVHTNHKLIKKCFPTYFKWISLDSIYLEPKSGVLKTDKKLGNDRKYYPFLMLFIDKHNFINASSIGMDEKNQFVTTIETIIMKNLCELINDKKLDKEIFHQLRDDEKLEVRKLFPNFYGYANFTETKNIYILHTDDELKNILYKSNKKGLDVVRKKIEKENERKSYKLITKEKILRNGNVIKQTKLIDE
jgi:hypothetical protein